MTARRHDRPSVPPPAHRSRHRSPVPRADLALCAGRPIRQRRQGQPSDDDPAPTGRSPRAVARHPRADQRGRMAGHDRAHRERGPFERAAHSGPHGIREISARTHRGARTVPGFGAALLYERHEAHSHRTRTAPLSEGAFPFRQRRRRLDGDARLGEPRALEAHALPVGGDSTGFRFTASRRRTCSASSPRPASRRTGLVRPACRGSGCSFCILALRADLHRAAELRPRLCRVYVDFRHASKRLTLVAGVV